MKKFTLLLAICMIATFAFAQAPVKLTKENLNRMQTEMNYEKLNATQRRNIMGSSVNGVIRLGKNALTNNSKAMKAPHNAMKAPRKAENETFPEIDYTLTKNQPEGTLKTYSREGGAFFVFWSYLIQTTQGGTTIDIVTAPDGKTVYMKEFLSQAITETWIKGTIEGNKIHIPLYQAVTYYEEDGYGLMIGKLDYEKGYDEEYGYYDNFKPDFTAQEMTFTIHEDGTISLDGTSEMVDGVSFDKMPKSMLALFWTDNFEWTGYSDYNSVYTEFNEVAKTMPEGLKVEDWSYLYSDGTYTYGRLLKAANDGKKFYIQGLSEYNPESVIEGTINDGKVTFESDQFMGIEKGSLLYFCGAKAEIETLWDDYYEEYYNEITYNYTPTLEMSYDAEKRQLSSLEDDALIINLGKGSSSGIYYMSADINPRLGYFEDIAATPADPEIVTVSDEESFTELGYTRITTDVKPIDVNGNFINPENIKYILWVKIDGEAEPFVFYADEYYSFAEDGIDELTEVPYNFMAYDKDDYTDIDEGGASIYIYQTGFDDYGIQTIYYGGGERNVSNISWFKNTNAISGISVNEDSRVKAVYSIDGKQLSAPCKGINIVRMTDGSVRKVLGK